jgi:thiol-disulfide isomerase/thioredoxin
MNELRYATWVLVLLLCAVGVGPAEAGDEDRPAWVPDEHVIGTLPVERFGQRLPVWEEAVRRHEPDAGVVEALRHAPAATIEILFATWCGDSYDHVPPLLSALREAANPDLHVELIGLGRDKMEPEGRGVLRRVERVPTIVVLREGEEIGRIVETPESSADRDVARILAKSRQAN